MNKTTFMTIALIILAASITIIGVYASIYDAQVAVARSSKAGHQHMHRISQRHI